MDDPFIVVKAILDNQARQWEQREKDLVKRIQSLELALKEIWSIPLESGQTGLRLAGSIAARVLDCEPL